MIVVVVVRVLGLGLAMVLVRLRLVVLVLPMVLPISALVVIVLLWSRCRLLILLLDSRRWEMKPPGPRLDRCRLLNLGFSLWCSRSWVLPLTTSRRPSMWVVPWVNLGSPLGLKTIMVSMTSSLTLMKPKLTICVFLVVIGWSCLGVG